MGAGNTNVKSKWIDGNLWFKDKSGNTLMYLDGANGLIGSVGINTPGKVYYVEGNAGDDDNDGLTWNTAYKTLAVAMAASHANIAASSSGWRKK